MNQNRENDNKPLVILAFSGGLDTSFCVPYLQEQGFDVVTMFADSGGLSDTDNAAIQARSEQLGAVAHHTVSIGDDLFAQMITPLIQAGYWYQQRYPLLCSDRYLIAANLVKLAEQYQTAHVAHGCTGMGNDQVRLDLSIRALGRFNIHAPIREIQAQHAQVREYEKDYLQKRGFEVGKRESRYTINENLLGITLSGAEVDEWQPPGPDSYVWTVPPERQSRNSRHMTIEFKAGKPVAMDGQSISGLELMQTLNRELGEYGIGRGIYTGDTTIGLKGRIVFEAPALTALNAAHKALEETVLTQAQNDFKPGIAKRWTELVYHGAWYEPLRTDLQAMLESTQQYVNGTVTLQLSAGQVHAVAVETDHRLQQPDAQYAQQAAWGQLEAEGFIRLHGQSLVTWADVHASKD